MQILSQTLYAVSRICELPDYPSSTDSIARCHKGLPWTTREGLNKKYSFLIVSSSVAIATAIGVLSVAGAGTASYLVAKSETDRVAAEQNALRSIDVDNGIHNNNINFNISLAIADDLDDIKFIAALSTQTSNRRYNAVQLLHKVSHMFSKSNVLSFNDPASEQWFSTVKSIVANNSEG